MCVVELLKTTLPSLSIVIFVSSFIVCCLFARGEAKFVLLGDLEINTNTDDADPQEFRIAKFIPHPEYRAPSHYHDIALLRLDRDVLLNPYVRPACLRVDKNLVSNKGVATGWGKTQYAGVGSNQLLKVTLELFNVRECNESYK